MVRDRAIAAERFAEKMERIEHAAEGLALEHSKRGERSDARTLSELLSQNEAQNEEAMYAWARRNSSADAGSSRQRSAER